MWKYSMQTKRESVADEAPREKRGNGNNKRKPRNHHL